MNGNGGWAFEERGHSGKGIAMRSRVQGRGMSSACQHAPSPPCPRPVPASADHSAEGERSPGSTSTVTPSGAGSDIMLATGAFASGQLPISRLSDVGDAQYK